jgi:hypothetical protein
MVFNATFNTISVMSWRTVLLVEETGVPWENHWPIASHRQTLSHNVVHLTLIEIWTHITVISGDRHWFYENHASCWNYRQQKLKCLVESLTWPCTSCSMDWSPPFFGYYFFAKHFFFINSNNTRKKKCRMLNLCVTIIVYFLYNIWWFCM